jgi:hypothetical protein
MTIFINGLILTIVNIFSILLGLYIYYLSQSQGQVAIRVVVACFLSVFLFLLWETISHRFLPKITLKSKKDHVDTFITSLVWTPFIFLPLSYLLSEGSVVSGQNITGIWLFQAPTNALIMLIYKNFSSILSAFNNIRKIESKNI